MSTYMKKRLYISTSVYMSLLQKEKQKHTLTKSTLSLWLFKIFSKSTRSMLPIMWEPSKPSASWGVISHCCCFMALTMSAGYQNSNRSRNIYIFCGLWDRNYAVTNNHRTERAKSSYASTQMISLWHFFL